MCGDLCIRSSDISKAGASGSDPAESSRRCTFNSLLICTKSQQQEGPRGKALSWQQISDEG